MLTNAGSRQIVFMPVTNKNIVLETRNERRHYLNIIQIAVFGSMAFEQILVASTSSPIVKIGK